MPERATDRLGRPLSPALVGWAKGKASKVKGRSFDKDLLTEDEIERLLTACSRRGACGARDRALIWTMYKTGMRVAEVLALRPKDLIENGQGVTWAQVLHGKGDKHRMVPVAPSALDAIDRWLERRAERGITKRAPIFCTLTGNPLSAQQVRSTLHRLGEKATLQKRVHPHGLRRACACALLDRGMSIVGIQGFLGHASLRTTQQYLQEANPRYLADEARRIDWL